MLLVLVSLAFAETIHCEATDGPKLVYDVYSKSGGAMPGPETLMDSESWSLDGVPIQGSGQTYGGEASRWGALDWLWDAKSTHIEKITGGRLNRIVTYTSRVTVWGEPKLNGGAPLTVTMQCTRDPEMGIP